MLAGLESNISRRGRFTSGDRCHVLSKYLPVNGPWIVDQTSTRAYVSQFSADGSLFVAAFQGSQIRIYDVDGGWKGQKNIFARSLRWTITDTSLSPDQRYLVYASMSPMIHIVNAGSSTRESLANVTADVDTVCFADESGHLIYSVSDDNVWDRRCFTARGKPAGTLVGHLEGITFIGSRGDGRYLISNGKDQAIKLWDVRKMTSNATCYRGYRNYEWNYRWMEYSPQARGFKHPYDQSIATYKGHSVLGTLIRCYFLPAYSTGQKYIYTGSHDSSVYVYDVISGAQVAKLQHHRSTMRHCNWHPIYPMLVSSSWAGDVIKWEFTGNGDA